MTWTAPAVARPEPPFTGDERAQLEAWLDYHRQTLLTKCAGLTADQLKLRALPPSSMSLLGLVRHMADVERGWFRVRIGGIAAEFRYSDDANEDGDFDDVDEADAEADLAAFDEEVALARQAVAGRSLDETYFHQRRRVDIDVRWTFLHMIEEYARHNGHADLLRERIDGAVGD